MNQQNSFSNTLLSILGMIIFIALLIASIFIFSYLFIVGAIIGLILFVVAKIRARFSHKKNYDEGRIVEMHFEEKTTRIIDQNKNDSESK